MGEWQPIATAPKDGTKIVLSDWCEHNQLWRFRVSYWRKYMEPYGEGFALDFHPTRWMPLDASRSGVETTPAGATVDTPDMAELVARGLWHRALIETETTHEEACLVSGDDWHQFMGEARAAIAAMPHPPEVVRLIEAARGVDAVVSKTPFTMSELKAALTVLRAALTPFRSETGS